MLPTTSKESCQKKGAEAIRRRVMDATALPTFVPTAGARTRNRKLEVAPPSPHAEDAEQEAARDFCVEILARVVARWTANLCKDAEPQSKMSTLTKNRSLRALGAKSCPGGEKDPHRTPHNRETEFILGSFYRRF